MTRNPKFEFDKPTMRAIGDRCNYRCAVCCKNLGNDLVRTLTNYHHVIPSSAGDPSKQAHVDFISSAENGVMLCSLSSHTRSAKDTCHGRVAHGDGRFAGFTADPEAFKHSHHMSKEKHSDWAKRVREWATENLGWA